MVQLFINYSSSSVSEHSSSINSSSSNISQSSSSLTIKLSSLEYPCFVVSCSSIESSLTSLSLSPKSSNPPNNFSYIYFHTDTDRLLGLSFS